MLLSHIMSAIFSIGVEFVYICKLIEDFSIMNHNMELNVIAEAMLEKKGQEVVSLDLKNIGTAISDYFIVCSADSTTNVSAIADNIEDKLIEKFGRKPLRSQGRENCIWIILDYGDIVAHIFQTPYRDFYRLEDLWADAERTEYSDNQ